VISQSSYDRNFSSSAPPLMIGTRCFVRYSSGKSSGTSLLVFGPAARSVSLQLLPNFLATIRCVLVFALLWRYQRNTATVYFWRAPLALRNAVMETSRGFERQSMCIRVCSGVLLLLPPPPPTTKLRIGRETETRLASPLTAAAAVSCRYCAVGASESVIWRRKHARNNVSDR
jgi:hypothetical protein